MLGTKETNKITTKLKCKVIKVLTRVGEVRAKKNEPIGNKRIIEKNLG